MLLRGDGRRARARQTEFLLLPRFLLTRLSFSLSFAATGMVVGRPGRRGWLCCCWCGLRLTLDVEGGRESLSLAVVLPSSSLFPFTPSAKTPKSHAQTRSHTRTHTHPNAPPSQHQPPSQQPRASLRVLLPLSLSVRFRSPPPSPAQQRERAPPLHNTALSEHPRAHLLERRGGDGTPR